MGAVAKPCQAQVRGRDGSAGGIWRVGLGVKIEVYVFKMVSVAAGLHVDGTSSREGKKLMMQG